MIKKIFVLLSLFSLATPVFAESHLTKINLINNSNYILYIASIDENYFGDWIVTPHKLNPGESEEAVIQDKLDWSHEYAGSRVLVLSPTPMPPIVSRDTVPTKMCLLRVSHVGEIITEFKMISSAAKCSASGPIFDKENDIMSGTITFFNVIGK